MHLDRATPGAHALKEILSQPSCWGECLQWLEKGGEVQRILHEFSAATDWLFVGCGTSYYLALTAAASWIALTGRNARAVPASDLLLFPDLFLSNDKPIQPILISRSGTTSEILKAAEYLKSRNVPTLSISCAANPPLAKLASAALGLAVADEKSTVMTRSFTSMLIALQYLGARLAKRNGFHRSLEKLSLTSRGVLDDLARQIESFVRSNDFADYVFLGQGPYYGLACEAALKVTEMSCSYAQSFHTLEFRHGPKSIVSSQALVTFLLSENGYEAERGLLEEVKSLGGTTLVIANEADANTQRAADLLLELHLDIEEYARLAAYILAGQLLGLYTGLKKELDPDHPRHLSRVVLLSGGWS